MGPFDGKRESLLLDGTLRLVLIYGSIREGRFCDRVAAWALGEIERHGGFAVDVVDPRAMGLPAWHQEAETPVLAALRQRLDRADAFVVVTPEHNHGYPAALKYVIDAAYREWRAKPVGFVSYGGPAGGVRAVEQLRQVFAELHAVTMRDAVAFANPWDRFDAAGGLFEPEVPRKAMATMLAHLSWWGRALGEARRATPYAERAA